MSGEAPEQVSSYLQYLPAYLEKDIFLGKFLLAFEQILSGGVSSGANRDRIIEPSNDNPPGFEDILDRIDSYFIPLDSGQGASGQSPTEFLPWLASWVALSLREDWKEPAKRAFISRIVPLYQLRGTKPGLEQILGLYMKNSGFPDRVDINDNFPDYPHYFQVEVALNTADPEQYVRQQQIAIAIINREKPCHTYYSLRILVPTMRITVDKSDVKNRLKIGKLDNNGKFGDGNTVLGTIIGT